MLTTDHELLVNLFRSRPAMLATLLREGIGVEIPPFADARIEEANFTEVVPKEHRADLAVSFRDRRGAPLAGLVIEVQRNVDHAKPYAWLSYWAASHARLRCWTRLVVVTESEAVAQWASEPVATFFPGVTPLVLGPEGIPWLSSVDLARATPELAVLSARAHGNEPGGLAIVVAAMAAIDGLREAGDERAKIFLDWLLAALSEATRRRLEADMDLSKYEYQSEFAKRYFTEGKTEGLADALLQVLAGRGFELGAGERARIADCRDVPVLGKWLERAGTASSLADVLAAV